VPSLIVIPRTCAKPSPTPPQSMHAEHTGVEAALIRRCFMDDSLIAFMLRRMNVAGARHLLQPTTKQVYHFSKATHFANDLNIRHKNSI